MRKVTAEDICSIEDYEQERPSFRPKILEIKRARRVHLGEHLTFLFENTDTIRYQVQEMMRAEGIRDAQDIQHELDTYNELVGDDGELGCTLLIEIDDPLQRDIVLRKWLALPKHIYLGLADGSRAYAEYDERQVGEDRLSSVQYMKFTCSKSAPVAVGMDLPGLEFEAALTAAQASALRNDLGLS